MPGWLLGGAMLKVARPAELRRRPCCLEGRNGVGSKWLERAAGPARRVAAIDPAEALKPE
jgi:hypothetical protein